MPLWTDDLGAGLVKWGEEDKPLEADEPECESWFLPFPGGNSLASVPSLRFRTCQAGITATLPALLAGCLGHGKCSMSQLTTSP